MERIEWNPNGDDAPSKCQACRARSAALSAINDSHLGGGERQLVGIAFLEQVRAVAESLNRYTAAIRASQSPDGTSLAEEIARLTTMTAELGCSLLFADCSCSRGDYRPNRSKRRRVTVDRSLYTLRRVADGQAR